VETNPPGIAGSKLIRRWDRGGATASLPTESRNTSDLIGFIDLPMPQETHNEGFRSPRPFGAVAGVLWLLLFRQRNQSGIAVLFQSIALPHAE